MGHRAPTKTYSPLVGAEITLAAGAEVTLEIDPQFEYGVLADTPGIRIHGHELARSELVYLPPGPRTLPISAAAAARFKLLGGAPLEEEIVKPWNFNGRRPEEGVAASDARRQPVQQ